MNPVARPRHPTSYGPSCSRRHQHERSSPPGEPTRGILTATCEALLAFNYPFAPRPRTPSPNGMDPVEREQVSNPVVSCLLTQAKSHLITEHSASKTGPRAARSTLKAVDRPQPALDQPQRSIEPGDQTSFPARSTGSITHREIVWLQRSDTAYNARLLVNQVLEMADGDGKDQTGFSRVIDAMQVLPETAGRWEELHVSSASVSSNPHSDGENRQAKFASTSSNSHLISPLAEVTDAYTGLQGGWRLPSFAPGFDVKQQPTLHLETDRCRRSSQKPCRVKKVDKKGKENKSVETNHWNHNQMACHHRIRRGQSSRTNSFADQSPLPTAPRGSLRI